MKKSFKLFLVALCAVFACLAFTGCPSPTTTPEPSTPVTPEPSAPVTPEPSTPVTPEPPVTYIGTKTPTETKAVGDIVFTDGSASPYTEELTNEQKAAAIAVIFYVGDENDTLGAKTLGVGLITERTNHMGLQWCLSDAVAYDSYDYAKNMDDGKANTDEIAGLIDYGDGTKYPAFKFCRDYTAKGFTTNWYLPAYNELKMLNASLTEVGNALNVLDIENPYSAVCPFFFSSTRQYNGNEYHNLARYFYFTDEKYNQFQTCKKDEYRYVCAIHTF